METELITVDPVHLFLVTAVGFGVSLGGTGLLIRYLTRRRILDRPNERSSHSVPTPRGGGIAVLAAIMAAWLTGIALSSSNAQPDIIILIASVALGVVCFIDDLRGLRALPRLLAQCAAVALGLWFIPEQGGLLHGILPHYLDLAVTGFLWLWFVNLFNFMDGIDGITGVEIATIGIGLAGLAAGGIIASSLLGPALGLTAAALGFLVWNWRPAQVFMGDVGSIPIGYLIGWLLINAAHGAPTAGTAGNAMVACLVLPAYYLADASITLGKRLVKRENIFQAHRQHFYQQAIIRDVDHGTVCYWIIAANAGLITTAWVLADSHPAAALMVSAVILLLLLRWMRGRPTSALKQTVTD
jgi:UDP-N-acetylmuramyl pentapeptide phosphotransferase/UDP-N-acetylglucosamine-1-phosphate transferase